MKTYFPLVFTGKMTDVPSSVIDKNDLFSWSIHSLFEDHLDFAQPILIDLTCYESMNFLFCIDCKNITSCSCYDFYVYCIVCRKFTIHEL